MTSPVCPACRAQIAIDAHACPRCGLAVRPTCSNCGEALEVRMHACPRCWEVIENPGMVGDGAVEGSILYEATGTEAVAVVQAPDQTAQIVAEQAPTEQPIAILSDAGMRGAPFDIPPVRPRRFRPWRLVLVGLVGGLLVAGGLVALEAVAPRLRGTHPDQLKLVREGFPDLDFGIGVPEGWDVRNEDVDGKPGVAVFEPVGSADDDRLRRFNVVSVGRSFDSARQLAGTRAPSSARDYDEIDITDGLRLDGRRAFRHRYADGDEYREEWWVQRGNGTIRVEFASPMSRREESAILFVRIARSFDLL